MSMDIDQYSRTIYGVFDLLSDVGGLFDILSNIGYYLTVVISFLLSLGLDRNVVPDLFSTSSVSAQMSSNSSAGDVKREINSR